MNQEKLYYLFEKSTVAIIIFNTQDGIQYVNHPSLRLFAYERHHLNGEPFTSLIPSSLHQDFESFIQSKKKSFYQTQIYLKGAKGLTISADMSIQRMTKESTMSEVYLASIYPSYADQTARNVYEIPDDEPSSKSQNLLGLLRKKTNLPLSTLNTLVDNLLRSNPRPDQRPLLENIQHSSQLLQEVMEDVLLYADLLQDHISLNLQPFNLANELKYVQHIYEARAQEREIDFKLLIDDDIPTDLVGDVYFIRQILEKLLNHLFAFTSEKKIRLQIILESKITSVVNVRFVLIDSGITSKHLLWLKQVFFNPSLEPLQEWERIGLSIGKHLIKKMGGIIHLENEPLDGVSILFSLPLAVVESSLYEAQADMSIEIGQSGYPLQGLRILYVEDVIPNHFLMEGLCSIWQVSLDTALNGQEALDKLQHNTYDVILMDLQMPIMNGYETTHGIRHASFLEDSSVPIIAVSGSASEDTILQIKKYGMNDFLSKPIKPEELYHKLLGYASS
ncbi:response regulator [Catalinimonas niigatensis]|uniref:response regulator n=1 Tax=Catalinimonas niigatensis TaxID=1397264 RepID=UPI002666563A|nr:response regulator [Catalinimonas niigatensis]WPP53619.1 response regulator [Catalinimonas niigatensis]